MTVASGVSPAVENPPVYGRVDRDRRQLKALYDVSRRLAAVHDTGEILSLIVNEATKLLAAEAAALRLLEGEDLVVVARTDSAAALLSRLRLKVGESLSGIVVATGQPVAVEDLQEDARYDPAHRKAALRLGFRGFLSVPLHARDQVIGTLNIYTKGLRRFTPDDISFLSAFADHASLAIEKARLYSEARRREEEATRLYTGLNLLNQASRALHRTLDVDAMLNGALGELARLLGAGAAFVNLLSETGEIERRVGHWLSEAHGRDLLRGKGGVTEAARRSRAPVLLHDIAEHRAIVHPAHFAHGVKSLAAFPVFSQDRRVLGMLFLCYTTAQLFPEGEVRLLTTYADQLGIALENAQLYQEARTQRLRLAQIFDSTSDGILFAGRDGRVETTNRRAGELLGFSPDQAIGLELGELLQRCGAADAARAAMEPLRALPEKPGEGELELPGTKRFLRWIARSATDASGKSVGLTVTVQDMTEEREVGRMKSDFVSFVTHQLRTPLAGIKWMLELAGQETGIPESAASFVRDAHDAAERLIALVNDLLDISRLERGKLAIQPRATDLGELTRGVLDELQPLIRDKGHRVAVTGTADVPAVLVDPQLMRQVVLNLVSNAIKYTPSGGDIAVRMGRRDGSLLWAIQDSGIGVPKSAQPRLFEKFYRAENVFEIETEGTGLGLYLVRLIVEQFGGRVWCESEEGEGATFLFTLPLQEND